MHNVVYIQPQYESFVNLANYSHHVDNLLFLSRRYVLINSFSKFNTVPHYSMGDIQIVHFCTITSYSYFKNLE